MKLQGPRVEINTFHGNRQCRVFSLTGRRPGRGLGNYLN